MRRRAISRTTYGVSGTVSFPGSVVYVFNPNYVELSLTEYTGLVKLSVSDGTNTCSIDVALYNGSAKCYISRLLQLLFDDYVSVRSKNVTISIDTSDGHNIASMSVIALWASVDLGMKFGYYLPFVYDGVTMPSSIREVVWFKNFPFKVSLFRESANHILYAMKDRGAIDRIFVPAVSGSRMPIWGGNTGIFEFNPLERYPDTQKELEYVVMKDKQVNLLPSLGAKWEGTNGGQVQYDSTQYGVRDNTTEDLYSPAVFVEGGKTLCFSCDKTNAPMEVYFAWITRADYGNLSDIYDDGDAVTSEKEGVMTTPDGRERAYYLFTTAEDAYVTVNIQQQSYIYRPQLEVGSEPTNFQVPGNVFDANFNVVFPELTKLAYIVRLHVCNDKVGVYLRWIDHYGFWQYYLFVKGGRTSKNNLSKNSVNVEYESNGVVHYAQRAISVENTDTLKCCAVSMRKEILAYVETIFKSPHIDMYLGKDFDGNEMWKPVNIEKGSVTVDAKKELFDYEITVTLPDNVTQNL